jgi:hypothetical protein
MAWSRDHRSRHNSCDARKPANSKASRLVYSHIVVAQYTRLLFFFGAHSSTFLHSALGKIHPPRFCHFSPRVFFLRARELSDIGLCGEAFEIAKAASVVVNNSIFT